MSRISKLRQSKNQQPTDKGDWNKGEFGASSVRVPRDDKTIKKDSPPLQLLRPAWNGPVPPTFRPLPAKSRSNESMFDHGRDESPTGWSDWMRYQVPVASFVGKDEKITFIMYDPRDKKSGYDAYSNPYNKLYWGVVNANKSQQAVVGGSDVFTKYWPGLVDPNNYKTRCLTKPTSMNYYQGLVYEYSVRQGDDWEVVTPIADGGTPLGAGPDDLTPVIQIKNSAGKALDSQLNTYVDGAGGSSLAWDDPVSLTDGPFISFFNPKKHGDMFEDFDLDSFTSQHDGFVGWGAHVSDTFLYTHKRKTYEVGNDISEYEDVIRDSVLWWDNVLHFPSHEEICAWLAQAFKSMPEVLRFCWQDDPEFFTDEVEGLLGDRTSAAISEPFEDKDEEDDVAPRVQQKSRSSAIPQLEETSKEEVDEIPLETDPLVEGTEEDLDDDLFGLSDDEKEEEGTEAADDLAHRRSRLRSPSKRATPRRRQ